jgi:lysophospholipase L1-like esterase
MRRFERYVAIGDSTTEGLEDPDGQGGYRGWANRFAEHLAREVGPIHYANMAVRGRQAGEVREEQLARALAMSPDVATVVAGVNDLLRPRFELDEVAGHVAAMIAALRAQGTTVLTFTMPDMVQVNPLTRLIQGRLDALNERLRQTCELTGALLLDLAAQSDIAGDPRLWHSGRLHANSLGHERIGLGLPLERTWNEPLPSRPRLTLTGRMREEAAWARDYLAPWLARHARGESSGDGRQPKRPALEPFSAP